MTDAPDIQPVAVDKLTEFDYATRQAALKLVHGALTHDPPHWQRADITDMLATADAPEVVRCLVAMAGAAFSEYWWAGRDPESAEHTVNREIQIAEELTDDPPTWGT
jgi:hypothetical protein